MTDWQQSGDLRLSEVQRKTLNAICGDLAAKMTWHGHRMSKDDWRHLICGNVLGYRMVPGIDRGDGRMAGLVMLGGSSLNLTRSQASEAITIALSIGDAPESQGLSHKPVRWSKTVLLALGYTDDEAERLA